MEQLFYVAACGEIEKRGGILLYRYQQNSAIEEIQYTPLKSCTYFIQDAPAGRLYAIGNTADGLGLAAAYKSDAEGKLTLLNQITGTGGSGYCHLALSPDRKFLYAVSYRGGYIEEFQLNGDGSLADAAPQVTKHTGVCGPNKARQEMPHPHFGGFTPDGKYLLVCDLGLDSVFAYPYEAGRGIRTDCAVVNRFVTPGDGPRHLLFDRDDANTLFLLCEMGNKVYRLTYTPDGKLTPKAVVSTVPEFLPYPTKAAALRQTPDGRFLLATNRGFDSAVILDKTDLREISLMPSCGSSPRDGNFLLDGKVLALTNEFSDNVYFFDVADNGTLRFNGQRIDGIPRPLCVESRK